MNFFFTLLLLWIISFLIIIIGFLGLFITRRNIITFLICLELLLFGINLNLICNSILLSDIYGLIFSLFLLSITAAESAVGLAILILYYKKTYILTIDHITNIKA